MIKFLFINVHYVLLLVINLKKYTEMYVIRTMIERNTLKNWSTIKKNKLEKIKFTYF